MAEKKITTRIVLTHDEYANLASKTLKAGEAILAKVGTTQAPGEVAQPIWMMKIGDGTSTVENCPWLVAPAADVYDWAKKYALAVEDVPTLPIAKIEGLENTLTGKADKVNGAVAGNFAGLDENGNLTDSGKKAADFAEAVHNHKAADLTDFSKDVKAVVDGLGITTEGIAGLGTRLTQAETDIDAVESAVATKVEQEDYNTKVTALEKADTDEAAARELLAGRVSTLEGASATHATKTELTDGLALKADKATYEAKIAELEKADTDNLQAAKDYVDEVKADILGEGITETFDTLKEIEDWIDKQGGEAVELTKSLAAETKAREDADKLINDELDTFGDIVTHNASEFATKEQGAKADTALQAADITGKADKVVPAEANNFALLDAEGNLVDSELNVEAVNDAIGAISAINDNKQDKITGTQHNVLMFGEDGAPTDSGISAGDIADVVGRVNAEFEDVKKAANAAVKGVTADAATGLKVTTTDGVANISFLDDVVFVLNGGTADNLN